VLLFFLGGLGSGCVPGIPGRDIIRVLFRCVVLGVVFLGGLWCGCVPGIPERDIIRVLFQMCCVCCCSRVDWGVVAYDTRNPRKRYNQGPVFGAVPRWIGVWLRTRNPRKRYNQVPISYMLCLALFLCGLGCDSVPGIPGRDK
jgi:hypothetical protein